MHRVELKELHNFEQSLLLHRVPNAPCGVEREANQINSLNREMFLMHRVELKVILLKSLHLVLPASFLMHRVELKEG